MAHGLLYSLPMSPVDVFLHVLEVANDGFVDLPKVPLVVGRGATDPSLREHSGRERHRCPRAVQDLVHCQLHLCKLTHRTTTSL